MKLTERILSAARVQESKNGMYIVTEKVVYSQDDGRRRPIILSRHVVIPQAFADTVSRARAANGFLRVGFADDGDQLLAESVALE